MKIVKPTKVGMAEAVATARRDGVVVYPTDTAYALGGKFRSRSVQQKILRIKKRRDTKFTLIASSTQQVEKFFTLSAAQKKLARRYWPGPLSIVVSPRFAIRVPDNRIARALARGAGQPLIATSANVSGQPTLFDSGRIISLLSNKKPAPDVLIDAGRLRLEQVSTIVAISDGRVVVLRRGAVQL